MAKRIAKKMIVGDASEEYSRVWDYAEAIRRFNPGSTAIVKCIGIDAPPPLFQRIYVCVPACKEVFVAGCRPIIGVDGAHLKGQFPGVLLTVVEDLRSVSPSSSWVQAGCEDFTFMSDRQKLKLGSAVGIYGLTSRSSSLESCSNITFGKQQELTTREMNEIKNISIEAYEYLATIPAKHWSRHAFSSKSKYGMLLNNCCESFNNVLVEVRRKPIISLMEWIEKNAKDIYGLRVIPVDVSEFEVDDDEESYVVNLTNKTCLCGSWNLIGIPCKIAMAYIVLRKFDASEFFHEAYLVETYAKTYAPKFYGMPGHKMWPTTTLAKPLPPPFRKMPGRPKTRK
ncbi:uncharacterized protein LOC130823243 [Amaranthus tricolor]|uniref:uncharacterized protein LOC130823243 n=1 Tax=Amaranthus tricolor TaxID=29722 RepID=UPI00258D8322|nr:uncharacterized protein LOC130823243 [Amaranthus tricolor]